MPRGRTSKYLDKTPGAREKHNARNRKYNKTAAAKKKRAAANKARKKLGLKKGDPRDAAHTKSGVRATHKSKNRGSKTAQAGDRRSRGGGKRRKKK